MQVDMMNTKDLIRLSLVGSWATLITSSLLWGFGVAETRRAGKSWIKAQQGKHPLAWHRKWGEEMRLCSTWSALQIPSFGERKISPRCRLSWGSLFAARRNWSGSQGLVRRRIPTLRSGFVVPWAFLLHGQPDPVPSCPPAGSVLVASGVQWNELCSDSLETIKGIKGIWNITERVLRWVGLWCPQGWAALGLLKSHSGSFSSRLDPLKYFSLKTSLHIHLSNS